jgi:hypothetical protein
MQNAVRLLVYLLLTVSVISCQKELSNETGAGGAAGVNGILKMKINGAQWVADKAAGASIFGGYIVITGISNDKKNFIIQLEDQGATTYQLDQQNLNVAALTDENEVNNYSYTTNQGQDINDAGGTVTVTKIDQTNKTISGTFSFKMFRDIDSKQLVITEGVFENLKYTTELPPVTGTDANFKVKIDGTGWTGKNVTGSVLMGNLMINATELDLSKTVGLSMPADISAGTHNLTQLGPNIGLYISGTTTLASSSGTLTITEHNKTTKLIKGTFNFEAKDLMGGTTVSQLTEGSFSVKYQ